MNEPRAEDMTSAPAAELDRLRAAIDATDRSILAALNERARLVQRVGEIKRAGRSTVYAAARERDLVRALQGENPGPFPDGALPAVFREIISATRSLEAPLRIAYLGPEGTFSHLAARQVFGSQVEFVGFAGIAEVFAAVERGDCDHGLVPVENTSEGVVTQTLDTFVDSDLPICGETLLRISHRLLSRTGRLEDVRRVASHPQPLAQCRGWLDRNLPAAERVEVASTAAAARLAAERPDVAAVGSALAGEREGLLTVAAGIEDRRDNTTRFLVIGGDAPAPSGDDVTSVVFTVRRTEAGALHRLLEPFARHGVNLASIQSRPLRGAPWEYLFFLDVEGHRSQPAVAAALSDAARVAHSCRVLGSFPRASRSAERPAERSGAERTGGGA
jgi:chorismate mutase/prephenate dehydratase